jgi:hypothetical protein
MGSLGSTRWGRHRKAMTVEHCRVLDAGLLARKGSLQPGRTGTVSWSRGGQEIDSVGFEVRQVQATLSIVLNYNIMQTGEPVRLPIPLETTPVHFGGVRWWFLCPLHVDGVPCGRRVGKLYLPPVGRSFGCRACCRLSYRSCQASHIFDGLFRKMAASMGCDFAVAAQAMNGLPSRGSGRKHLGGGRDRAASKAERRNMTLAPRLHLPWIRAIALIAAPRTAADGSVFAFAFSFGIASVASGPIAASTWIAARRV